MTEKRTARYCTRCGMRLPPAHIMRDALCKGCKVERRREVNAAYYQDSKTPRGKIKIVDGEEVEG